MTASTRGSAQATLIAGATRTELNVLALIDHLALGGAEMLLGQFAAAAPRAAIRLQVAYLENFAGGSPAAKPLQEAGIDPVDLNLPGRPSVHHVRVVRRYIRAVHPDVVHTHLGAADLVGGLAARSLGVPHVSTVHAVVQRHSGIDGIKDILFTACQRFCAARVIVVSDSARRAYLERTSGMDRRVVRIYNGVDVAASPGSGADIRRELGINPDDLVIGMVSALRPVKGHDVAIATLARLLPRFPHARMLIVGQGPRAAELARLAAPLGDRVVFAGRRTDIPNVFDAFDVCLHPSHLDAFPTTLIEALATSVPVLATAVGGIPEIIEDGRTGVLVPAPPNADRLVEALGGLLADPSRRNMLSDNGRRTYLRRFTAEPWVQNTRALYDSVLAETTARHNHARERSRR